MLHYLELAAEVADLSTDIWRKAFVGAVAIRRDKKIVFSRNGGAFFHNSRLPKEGRLASVHAEARVLRKSGYGAVVYVARVKRDGSFGLAKPCELCEAALKAYGVKNVYYTISDKEWGGIEF